MKPRLAKVTALSFFNQTIFDILLRIYQNRVGIHKTSYENS